MANYVSYGSYGRRRKKNTASKVVFGILALASLVLVLYMFMEYTASVNLKNDLSAEIDALNEQSSFLAAQKTQKEEDIDALNKELAALEAEYASYQN